MRVLAAPLAIFALAALAACGHDESPPQTPVGQVHTTSAPAPAPQPTPIPNTPNAAAASEPDTVPSSADDRAHRSPVRDDFTPLAPGLGGTTTPGGQYGNGTPVRVTPNGGFDPIRDADEHGSGVSGHPSTSDLPSTREPTRATSRDGGV